MIAKDSIFREYDIRGVVGIDFNADFAFALGRAIAELVKKDFQGEGIPVVAVGYDCRTSSPELTKKLGDGLTAAGVNVFECGMGPTPQLYFMVVSKNLGGGVQVTASHNPGEFNGFKMMIGKKTLSGPDIQLLKKMIKVEKVQEKPSSRSGDISSRDARKLYIEELVTRSKPMLGKKRVRVVVDGGNGVGGLVGPELLRQLNCEVEELFTEPDGSFPNHHPDPTVLENLVDLQKRVIESKADVGIAWDGDADRIGVVDERGTPIFGDMLVVLFGRQLLKEVKNPTIIADVKCSEILFKDLEARGANAVMAKTGHSLMKAKLKELNAHLAGEMSGHIFFAHRYYGFDDALHASARLIEILSNTNEPLSSLLSDLPKTVSTPELRLDCPDDVKFLVAEKAKALFPEYKTNTLDGVRVTFPNGWGLVRASNTQPALVMRFEAETTEQLTAYKKIFEERITKLQKELKN